VFFKETFHQGTVDVGSGLPGKQFRKVMGMMCHAQSSRLGTELSLMIHISRYVLICALIIAQDLPRSAGGTDIRTNRAVRIEGLHQVETTFFDCHVGLVGIFVPYLSTVLLMERMWI
jgi:hypothetical protein